MTNYRSGEQPEPGDVITDQGERVRVVALVPSKGSRGDLLVAPTREDLDPGARGHWWAERADLVKRGEPPITAECLQCKTTLGPYENEDAAKKATQEHERQHHGRAPVEWHKA